MKTKNLKADNTGDKIHAIMMESYYLLATCEKVNLHESIDATLANLGMIENIDRVYVFAYDFVRNVSNNTNEWCNDGIEPMIDLLQDYPLDGLDEITNKHKQGELVVYNDVFSLDPIDPARGLFEPQGIKSVLLVPMMYKGICRGFVGFDAVKDKHIFGEEESELLFRFAGILIHILRRMELEDMLNDANEKLEFQNKRLNLFLDSSQAGTWEYSQMTGDLQINENFANLLGFSWDKLKRVAGDHFMSMIHPEDLHKLNSFTEKTDVGDGFTEVDFRIRHKSGTYIWLKTLGRIMNSTPSNESANMYGIVIDITASKERELEYTVIKHAVDNSAASVVITGSEGDIEYVNPKFTELTGYEELEVLGQNTRILQSGLHEKSFYQKMWDTISNGKEWTGEFYNKKKDGSCYWEKASISAVYNNLGKIVNYVGIKYDITDQRKMEDTIRQQNQLFNTLSQMVPGALYQFLWSSNGESKYIFASAGFKEIYELDPSEILENPSLVFDKTHPEDRKGVDDSILEAGRNKKIWNHTFRIALSEERIRWINIKARPEILHQGDVMWYGYVMDVTKDELLKDRLHRSNELLRLSMERAEEANHAKSRFLGNMSHEIRTPLNALLGFSRILELDKTLNPSQKEKVESITASSRHLLDLLNDVLDLSKIEAGKEELHLVEFSIPALIESLRLMFLEEAQKKRLYLIVEPTSNLTNLFYGDLSKIRQILINLLSNAIKYTVQGSVRLNVKIREKTDDVWNLAFVVVDSGVGLEDGEVERLFDLFYHNPKKVNQKGMGLGLPISRRYAEMMGGIVYGENNPIQGSTFVLKIPLRVSKLNDNFHEKVDFVESMSHKESLCKHLRIVLVDPDFNSAQIVTEFLFLRNGDVHHYEALESALKLLEEFHADVVLLDLREIKEITEEDIHRIRQHAYNCVLGVLTSQAIIEDEKNAIERGADFCLIKPYSLDRLIQEINRSFAKKNIFVEKNEDSVLASKEFPTTEMEQLERFVHQGDVEQIIRCLQNIKSVHAPTARYLEEKLMQYDYHSILKWVG